MQVNLEPEERAADLRARAQSIVDQMRAMYRVMRRERRLMTARERRKFVVLGAELDQLHAEARDLAPLLKDRRKLRG